MEETCSLIYSYAMNTAKNVSCSGRYDINDEDNRGAACVMIFTKYFYRVSTRIAIVVTVVKKFESTYVRSAVAYHGYRLGSGEELEDMIKDSIQDYIIYSSGAMTN